MAAPRQEGGWDPPVASPQAPVTFEDVAVQFSAEEWELLEEWQRELHREVTEGTSWLLASLGSSSSPALAALVRLVKEIPEFLFGGPRADADLGATTSGNTAVGSERMGVNVTMEMPSESCPLRSLERCLEELAGRGPGPSVPPASSLYDPTERHQEEPGGHQPLCGRRSLRGPSRAVALAAAARCCPQAGDGAGCPVTASSISSTSTTAGEAAPCGMGWSSGLCRSPMLLAGGSPAWSVGQSPLRGLQECLQGIGIPNPIRARPAAASGTWGAVGTGTGDHSPTAAGVTALAVPPQSPTETQALGASSTAMPRDSHHASSTGPPAHPPTMGTATKRPFAEVGAMSPTGCSACPSGCIRASSPKNSEPKGSPPAPRQPLGEAQHPRAEVGCVHVSIMAEELERLCRELGSVRREACGVWSRLARLERGWARELAALTRGHRHLRRAIRCLQRRCWPLETSSRLPHGAGGANAITSLQTELLPALAQLRLHGLLRFTEKLALMQAAPGCPELPCWAGAHLIIVPIACPHRAGPALLPAGLPGWRLPAMAKALWGCE